MYSGTLIADLIATVDRAQSALTRGPNNDGRMTPGDVQGWFDLEAMKEALCESKTVTD